MARLSQALVAVLLVAVAAAASAEDAATPRRKPSFGRLSRRYPADAQSWRATPPGAPIFAHLARGDVLSALNASNNSDSSSPIPKSFSWCDVGGGVSLCAPSWQQHNAALAPPGARYCGSCFLHATLSAVQDRIKGMRHLQALKRRVESASSSSPAPPSSSNAQDVVLGRQAFLNCAPLHGFSKGCNGGEPLDVYHYMSMHGLPDEGCVPYSATDHTRFKKKKNEATTNEDGDDDAPASSDAAPALAAQALRRLRGDESSSSSSSDSSDYLLRGDPKCRGPKRGQRQCQNCMPLPEDPKKAKKEGEDEDDDGPIPAECWAVERPIRYGLRAFGKVPQGEENIQREILARGPVVCGIACPEKFVYGYRSGVYVDDQKDKELDHDVEIVGWGEEEDEASGEKKKYWLIRNSWGTYWGELGFFKLERGVNSLQIESGEDGSGDCWWAEPDLRFEDEVVEGDWAGTMYGLKKNERRRGAGEASRAIDEALVSTAAV